MLPPGGPPHPLRASTRVAISVRLSLHLHLGVAAVLMKGPCLLERGQMKKQWSADETTKRAGIRAGKHRAEETKGASHALKKRK